MGIENIGTDRVQDNPSAEIEPLERRREAALRVPWAVPDLNTDVDPSAPAERDIREVPDISDTPVSDDIPDSRPRVKVKLERLPDAGAQVVSATPVENDWQRPVRGDGPKTNDNHRKEEPVDTGYAELALRDTSPDGPDYSSSEIVEPQRTALVWRPPLDNDIPNAHAKVVNAVFGHAPYKKDRHTEAQLVDAKPQDAATTGFIVEVLKVRHDQKEQAKSKELSPPSGKGTELAESITDNQTHLLSLLDWAVHNPRGMRAAAIESAESNKFTQARLAEINKADKAVQDQFASKPKDVWWNPASWEANRTDNLNSARQAAQDAAREKVLESARRQKHYTLDWFNAQTAADVEASNEDGLGGKEIGGVLWKSLQRQPSEMPQGGWRKLKVNPDIGNFENTWSLYNMHVENGNAQYTTSAQQMEVSPARGRAVLWQYIEKLDKEYCDNHPGEISSPETLRRLMILGALHSDMMGKYKAPVEQPQDDSNGAKRKRVNIMETSDGPLIEALDIAIHFMNQNAQDLAFRGDKATYQSGSRPGEMHPDIIRITALRIALSSRAERINGAVAERQYFDLQVRDALTQQLNMAEAVEYLDPEVTAKLYRGDFLQLGDTQLGLMAQIHASAISLALGTKGEVAAMECQNEAIQELGAMVRGRDTTVGDLSVRKPNTIGGFTEENVATWDIEDWKGLRTQLIQKVAEIHAEPGSTPADTDNLDYSVRRLTDMIQEKKDRQLIGGGDIEEEEQRLVADAKRREYEAQFPAKNRVHLLIGENGDPTAYTSLIAVLGEGDIRQVTHEGEPIDPAVMQYWNQYSREKSTQDKNHNTNKPKPLVFSRMSDRIPRNIQHAMIIGLGDAPPLESDPQHVLDQLLQENGIALIPADAGWEEFGDELMDLVDSPLYAPFFMAKNVASWDISAESNGQVKKMIMVTTGKVVDNNFLPNETYQGLLRRMGRNTEDNLPTLGKPSLLSS